MDKGMARRFLVEVRKALGIDQAWIPAICGAGRGQAKRTGVGFLALRMDGGDENEGDSNTAHMFLSPKCSSVMA